MFTSLGISLARAFGDDARARVSSSSTESEKEQQPFIYPDLQVCVRASVWVSCGCPLRTNDEQFLRGLNLRTWGKNNEEPTAYK